MHIGFLTPEYPHPKSTSSGGLGTSIKNLASSLVAENIKVSVFVYGQKTSLRFKEYDIEFHFIEQRKYKFFGWYLYRKHLQAYLNTAIIKNKIDLIEAPDWTGITAFMKFPCPLIIRMNGSDAYFCALECRRQKFKNRFFENSALGSTDALVSVSSFTAEKTREIFKLKRDIEVIPNSIEADKFSGAEEVAIKNRVLYFGTLIRKKGVLELAGIFNEVINRNSQAELFLIGKDVVDIFEDKSTLEMFQERLSVEAADQVKYFPEVSYSEIKEHISRAAVIVLPSFAEALPMTWLEAMAMEKPLVTSNIGWAKEVMLNEVTGFTEDPKDHKAYAEKILYLLDNPCEAAEMGKAARDRVKKKFSTQVVVKRNLAFYKKIVENGKI
ncbi:glycosyltransferase family 4 protein [Salegentibacter sp. UBA1130]|uniref:glycosyltransferase family 4 protein n=1 Tax=Salegentibacter sp. UBA1130 TaxID=1947451 RepID=UPI00257C7FAD|nr:glycosyltransferase family 4 protein [Salegentibacter sp. UBA1130]